MKILTRITPKGIIQERIFSTPTEPGPPASVSIEIPGYTQAGDEIGGGGGGGGGGLSAEDEERLQSYLGNDDPTIQGSLGQTTGRVTLNFVDIFMGSTEPYVGATFTIHDVGNGRDPQTIEFVTNPGDSTTVPGAYAVSTDGKSLTQLRDEVIDIINNGDTLFSPAAWSLVATPVPDISSALYINYTGEGGASGGAAAIDDSMDVTFEESITYPYPLIIFSNSSLTDTTIDGRLSLVEPGDGCITIPLTTPAGSSTWSTRYPIHPNGITITGMSLWRGASWAGSAPILLDVHVMDSSGTRLTLDLMQALEQLGIPIPSGYHGWPLHSPGYDQSSYNQESHSVILTPDPDDSVIALETGPATIYVGVRATGTVTSKPTDGTAKLSIFYRVNSI